METEEKIDLIKKTIEKIRPYIQNDGGDVEFVRLEDNIANIACNHTLAIMNILIDFLFLSNSV